MWATFSLPLPTSNAGHIRAIRGHVATPNRGRGDTLVGSPLEHSSIDVRPRVGRGVGAR